MTLAAGLAALGFVVAAVLAALGPRGVVANRVLAVVSALLLLPAIDVPSCWPFLALGAGAAALGSPLPCALAAAGATLVALRPESATVSVAPVFLALAAALAAGAVASSAFSRSASSSAPPTTVALAGASLVILLPFLDGGRVLHWGFGLGRGTSRFDLPGAGLLLALALLVSLLGTLLLLVRLVVPGADDAATFGVRMLLPGAGLAVLAAAHVIRQGLPLGKEALAPSATGVAALVLTSTTLAAALAWVVAAPTPSETGWDRWAARETALATALVWAAVAVAGYEGWRAAGTYATALTASATAAALAGTAASAPTPASGLLRIAFLAGLILAVV